MQLVPPFALLAAGALSRGSRGLGQARGRRSRWWSASCSRPPATSSIRSCRSRTTSRCRATSPPPPTPTTRSTCGAACPRSTGRRAVARRRASSRQSFLTGNYPGRPPTDANTGADTEAAWEDFYEDFTAHPPKYFVDTSPAKVRGAQYYPISDFPRLEHIVDTQYKLRRHHRRHRRLQAQVAPLPPGQTRGQGVLCQSPGRGRPRSSSTWARRSTASSSTSSSSGARRSSSGPRRARRAPGTRRRPPPAGSRSPANSQMTVRSFYSSWKQSPWSMPTITSLAPVVQAVAALAVGVVGEHVEPRRTRGSGRRGRRAA